LFAILDAASATHVGNIKIGPVNAHHGYADVSYFIGERDYWGHGLATDAIRAVCAFGFERLGLHRVQAGVYAGNLGSRRALEKVGLRLEARFREQLVTDSARDDHLHYGLLRAEWAVSADLPAGC